MSTQISKEDLLNFTHQLHNKLRGMKGIKLTGLPALNEIENILFFRFMEEIKDIKDIPDEITFTSMCEKYATDKKIQEDKKIPHIADRNCFKLWDEFYNPSNTNEEGCILVKYLGNETIKKYIQSAVTRISAFTDEKRGREISPTIQVMFNMVYNKFKNIKFDSTFYDIFGSAHEEFKTNEHGNGGKGMGQHFTPMEIKQYITEELNVKSTESYYEPCAGTGGFIHTIDKYVREKEGEKASKKFKKNIYANECNPESVKPLMINMLLHDIPINHIHERDSLSNENCEFMKNKIDVIGTNYPFGMSNTIELNDYDDKDYWKVLVRGKNVIKNSTGQFIIHIYKTLNKNGRAGFVSDRGILNNGDDSTWEGDIRKYMVTNSNVYKIVLLPKGIFPYTPFATCVLFIKKGEKTENVRIYESNFIDIKKRKGLVVDKEPIKTVSLKELEKNGYSFKLEEKVEKIQKGWITLGEVVEFQKGKSLTKEQMIEGGIYNVIGGGYGLMDETYKDYNCDENTIIMSNDGAYAGYINKFNKKIFITGHCNKIIIKNDTKYKKDYIYYFLKINIQSKLLKKDTDGGFQIGQGTPSIDKKLMLTNIYVPSLSLQHQQEIVEFLDKQFALYDINLLAKQIKDTPLFNFLIDKKYDLFEHALHLIYRKMELDALHTKMEKDKKAVFNIRVGGLDCKEYKLGDIVEIKKGTFNTSDIDNTGKYPYYNSGINNPCSSHSEYSYDYNEYILFIKDGGDKNNPFNLKTGMCKPFYVNGKCAVMSHLMVFTQKVKNYKLKYLYYYLNYTREQLMKHAKYNSGLGHIGKDIIYNHMIPIPSLQDQEKIIKDIEKIESEQSSYKKYGDMLQEQIDSISKVIENLAKNNKEEDNNSNSESDESESESSEEKPKKIVKTKQVKLTKQTKKIKKQETSSESSESESSEDEPVKEPVKEVKPVKKTKQTKKQETSSESESEDELPKKKAKATVKSKSK
jgi:type I restriction-modification system DNA methylase subunit